MKLNHILLKMDIRLKPGKRRGDIMMQETGMTAEVNLY